MLFWYLFGVVLLLIAVCEYYTAKTGVPTITSYPSIRQKMIEVLRLEAEGHRGTDKPFTVLDLGSGTGKLALEIGRALPSARVTGVEISVVPYTIALLRQWIWRKIWGVKNVSYRREDFWTCPVGKVDAIVVYPNDSIRDRLSRKLREEMPSGALVIINETHLTGWTPLNIYETGLLKLKVVVYRQA